MSEQAIETLEDENEVESEELDTELETETELEETAGAETEGEEEVEIVFEGEDEPTSKPTVPLNKHLKVKKLLKGKIEAESQEKSAAEKRAEMLEEELKLYQMKDQNKPKSRPKPEDFDTDESYETELDQYYAEKSQEAAAKIVEERLSTQQTQATQTQNEQQLEDKLLKHYERAAELKVSNYDEAENRAVELFGLDIAKQIMANYDKAHILLYHFGLPANEAKAQYWKGRIESNPIGGLMELGDYAKGLKQKSKRSTAPDPETKVEGGVGVGKDQLRHAKGATFT